MERETQVKIEVKCCGKVGIANCLDKVADVPVVREVIVKSIGIEGNIDRRDTRVGLRGDSRDKRVASYWERRGRGRT